MSTIEQQIELERKMVERGKELYRLSVDHAEDAGRGHETTAARKLMQEFIRPLAEALQVWADVKGPGANGRFRPLIRIIDPNIAMYLCLYKLFDSFAIEQGLTTTAGQIGAMVEDELRFSAFKDKFSDYYDEVMKDFKRKGTENYRHKHRVLSYKAKEHGDEWVSWSPSERIGVGMKLIDIVLEHTDLIQKVTFYQKGKAHTRVEPTESAAKWIEDHHAMRELLNPVRMPCVIEPDAWTDLEQGGYYSPELRNLTNMIKVSRFNRREHAKHIKREWGSLGRAVEAINIVQRTPWAVNSKVLEIQRMAWAQNLAIGMPHKEKLVPGDSPVKDIPKDQMTDEQMAMFEDWKQEAVGIYTAEKERVAKSFQTTRILKLAGEYQDMASFWYVWYFDFRGRMYTATNGFSPQGPDMAKGLLRFANGKPLGRRGMYWLKVNMANRFGYDKESYDTRVKWVEDQHDEWMRIAQDPLSYRLWAKGDKPWQLLATIFEYAEAHTLADLGFPIEEYVSHIPVGLDGSCNGLQNFSAMLRDKVGGLATNLVPADKPADIYTTVGTVATGKLRRLDTSTLIDESKVALAQWYKFMDKWAKGFLPRVIPKRPVMTLPYGATRQSCITYIFDGIRKTEGKDKTQWTMKVGRFRAATFLTPYLWSSIGEVVVAARVAMDWLQKCARIVAKENQPLTWKTPDGFPVFQRVNKTEDVRVCTELAGYIRLQVSNFTDQVDPRSMASAASPNFVHSMDATHLRETVRRCAAVGITDLACIHDDYGTHACNTDELHSAIREAFIYIYANHCPLTEFRDTQVNMGHELPEVPPKGELDIQQVRHSLYFFG